MVNIVKNFSQVHDISQNNIIIGDFNIADADMDKGKGMDTRDIIMHSLWEGFISQTAMVDPFLVHSPKRRIYSFVSNAGKSRGDRVYDRLFEEELVDGYRQRTRGLPAYEQGEHDIAFYAKLEKRSAL